MSNTQRFTCDLEFHTSTFALMQYNKAIVWVLFLLQWLNRGLCFYTLNLCAIYMCVYSNLSTISLIFKVLCFKNLSRTLPREKPWHKSLLPVCARLFATPHEVWLLTSLSATKLHHFLCGSYLGTSFGCDELRERDVRAACVHPRFSAATHLYLAVAGWPCMMEGGCVPHNWEKL